MLQSGVHHILYGHIMRLLGPLHTSFVSGERTTSCVVGASVAMLRHDTA
jgi:hypothetical protein